MSIAENIRYELDGRFAEASLGKRYLSVRYEPGARIVRVGACLDEFTWENRAKAIEVLLAFEGGHEDDFAVEFDVVPLDSVTEVVDVEIYPMVDWPLALQVERNLIRKLAPRHNRQSNSQVAVIMADFLPDVPRCGNLYS